MATQIQRDLERTCIVPKSLARCNDMIIGDAEIPWQFQDISDRIHLNKH